MIFHSLRVFWILQVYAGLVIFLLFVLLDTQWIAERAAQGHRDEIVGALQLFLDFIQIFVRILLILLQNRRK